MIIAGDDAGSLWHSQEGPRQGAGPKELFLIKDASHMDLYDGEGTSTAVNSRKI